MKPSDSFSLFAVRIAMSGWIMLAVTVPTNAAAQLPLGPVGSQATYVLETTTVPRDTTVKQVVVSLGSPQTNAAGQFQWLQLDATKMNGSRFRIWLLAGAYPENSPPQSATNLARYILQEGDAPPKEYVHRFTGNPVLPSTGAWEFLWPRPEAGDFRDGVAAPRVVWLGHTYTLESSGRIADERALPELRRIELLPDVLVGVSSNQRWIEP
jgi:hypothetical protein